MSGRFLRLWSEMMRLRNRIQREIDNEVAAVTGEDLRVVRHRGFSIVDLENDNFDPEPDLLPPQTIDWDELESSRTFSFACQKTVPLQGVA
jgi:hypothetical protein